MNEETNGGQAFPKVPDEIYNGSEGMSLRDYFAGKAIGGIMSNGNFYSYGEGAARVAYEMSDAMLEERNK